MYMCTLPRTYPLAPLPPAAAEHKKGVRAFVRMCALRIHYLAVHHLTLYAAGGVRHS
jgi:hypothetical protein